MSTELLPVGQACNLKCSYCYENDMRNAGNIGGNYDVQKMIDALEKRNEYFTLFGGEPLLMRFEDLETVLEYGFKKWKRTGVQTNGTLITDRHVELFRRCNTHVGISSDGAGELSNARHGHCDSETKEQTQKTQEALVKLVKAGLDVGLIITLHKDNATKEKLPLLKQWLKWVDNIPIKGEARLHLLEGHHSRDVELSGGETIYAFLELAKFEMTDLKNLRFDKFKEMLVLLSGSNDRYSCVWNDCDPYTTDAVQGVNGDGSPSNCGRANKDGVNWVKAESTSHIRQIALYHTPQQHGGCKDCRFFLCCRGHCPGTAVDQDWRNRTEHCGVIKALYGYFEEHLMAVRTVPVSLRPERRQMEGQFLRKLQYRVENQSSGYSPHEDWVEIDGKRIYKVPVVS